MHEQSSCPPLQNQWSYFERIYCITLSGRDDRRHSARLQFERVGLADRVEFVVVAKHPTNSEQGIFESHLKCLRMGLEAKADTILIFEDDVEFEPCKPRVLENGIRFLESHTPWDVFFLGCFVRNSSASGFPSVLKVRFQCTTHAYVCHAAFAKRLVNLAWKGVAYDDTLRFLTDARTYALYPAIAFQSNSPSDNDALRFLTQIRFRLGGIHGLQKLNEFIHRNLTALLAFHLMAIIVIVCWRCQIGKTSR
jgi:GR25 family glycosyltransferase involved in LPS biosynthesis